LRREGASAGAAERRWSEQQYQQQQTTDARRIEALEAENRRLLSERDAHFSELEGLKEKFEGLEKALGSEAARAGALEKTSNR